MYASKLRKDKSDPNLDPGRDSESSRFSNAPKWTKDSLKRKEPASYRLAEKRVKDIELKRRLNERQYRRKLILRQKRVQEAYEYEHFPTLLGFYFDGFHTQHFYLKKEWADILNEVEEEFTRKRELDYHETFKEMQARYFWPPDCCGTDACQHFFRTRGIYLDHPEVVRDPPQQLMDPTDLIHLEEKQKFTALETLGNTKNSYYFDEDAGGFFHKSLVKADRLYWDKKNQMWRLKRTTRLFANDFYFAMKRGRFELKDGKLRQSCFTYSITYNIWVEKKRVRRDDDELKGLSPDVKSPKDFYFDELLCRWLLIPKKTRDPKVVYDENGRRFVKKIPLRNPDDYYFDFDDGTFKNKNPSKAKLYQYNIAHGAWVWPEDKWIKSPKKDKMLPRNYYFSETLGKFALKKGPVHMYEFDANNRIYRKKKFLQGKHRPENWRWDTLHNQWVYITRGTGTRSKNVFNEASNWRSDRTYEKPWLDYTMGRNWLLQKHPKAKEYNEDLVTPSTKSKLMPASMRKILSPKQKNPDRWYTGSASGKFATQPPASWNDEDADNDQLKIAFDRKSEVDLDSGMSGRGYGLGSAKSSALAIAGKQAFEQTGSMSDVFVMGSEKGSIAGDRGRTATGKTGKYQNEGDSGTLDSSSLYGGDRMDERIDRKRLKVSNLGGALTERDIKAYFYAAMKVKPPVLISEDEQNTDFYYIKFPSEQAALAAIKVMQGVDVKGQLIKLEYVKRNQY